jgi:hypothetical protein
MSDVTSQAARARPRPPRLPRARRRPRAPAAPAWLKVKVPGWTHPDDRWRRVPLEASEQA